MRIGPVFVLLILASRVGGAQDTTRFSLSGTVRDAAGTPVRDAQVVLKPTGLVAATSDRGWFRFPNLAKQRYSVTVRRLGYLPARLDLPVADNDSTLDIVLQPLPLTLSNVAVSATRIGLNGIVLDSGGIAVAHADVRAIPVSGNQSLPIDQRTNHQTRTNNEGVFFLPLVGGGYELRATQSGKGRVSSPVYVPRTGSRCVVVGFAFPSELLAQGSTCRALSDSTLRPFVASDRN